MKTNLFKITTHEGNVQRIQIWDPDEPITLGSHGRWSLEYTPTGPLVRRLQVEPLDAKQPHFYHLQNKSMHQVVQLELEPQFKVTLKSIHPIENYLFQERSLLFWPAGSQAPKEELFFRRLAITLFAVLTLSLVLAPEVHQPKIASENEEQAPTVKYYVKRTPIEIPKPPAAPAPPPAAPPPQAAINKTKPLPLRTTVAKKVMNPNPGAALARLFGAALNLAKKPTPGVTTAAPQIANLFKGQRTETSSNTNDISVNTTPNGASRKLSSLGAGIQLNARSNLSSKLAKEAASVFANSSDIALSDAGLSQEEVGAVIHSHMDQIRYCHEAAITYQPDVNGKLVVRFVISPAGLVKAASLASSTANSNQLSNCVIKKVSTFKFPKPKGGNDVTVEYPFVFKMLEQV